jgi:hypothetical protein
VLDRMRVQYRETKSGFECIHLPSIDISSVQDGQQSPPGRHGQQQSSGSNDTGQGYSNTLKNLAKKSSKMSFKPRRDKTQDREREGHKEEGSADTKDREHPGRPSGATTLTATPSSGSSSFFHISSNHTVVANEPQQLDNGLDVVSPEDASSSKNDTAKCLPPVPRDLTPTPQAEVPSPIPTGEVDREFFELISANTLSVRFEINIVKVSARLVGGRRCNANGDA